MSRKIKATLKLENKLTFSGFAFGYLGSAEGEVVFNTGMTGYPEALTDPSYSGQILVFTYPMIGNYGVPKFTPSETGKLINKFEYGKIQVQGIIVSNYSFDYSHFDATQSLHQWLENNKIPGIYGIDTRELTKVLRTKGVMLGKITLDINKMEEFNVIDPNKSNLASHVCIKKLKVYKPFGKKKRKKILLIDCGVKNSIIRNFLERDTEVIRVPHNYNPLNSEIDFDGIFISNGPGDPKMCKETVQNVRNSFTLGLPIFGICLGSQIMGLAAGADTFKLKFGHRSQNQPCLEKSGRCYITSQNHGYAVKTNTLPKNWEEWFVNNNDGTNEGIKHKTKPYFGVQFHPESSPGPNDTGWLFDKFIESI